MKKREISNIKRLNIIITSLGLAECLFILIGCISEEKLIYIFLIIPIILSIFVTKILLDGYAVLIQKTASIEELLKNKLIPQEDIINKNVYSISQNLYTRNNYNDEFQNQLMVNKQILETLKSIDEKLDKQNNPKKKNTK